MTVDASVTAALETAVAADPSNAPLRLHLASMLVMGGDPARALEHAQTVLLAEPDHTEALSVARDAARASGDAGRAASYERLLGGVGSAPPEPPPRARLTSDAAPDAAPDEPFAAQAEDLSTPEVTLADVGGLQEVKDRLETAFLAPLRNPELRAFYGTSLRGGLLLYGPPGCGKTFLARAVAGELGARFVSIGIVDVLDMYLGESERQLHEIFAAARRAAPCVVFLDELDALGQKRSQMRNSAGRTLVNQLLAELDGSQSDNEGLFVLAATNHPWDVDTALRRPGRLDRTLLVLPPDEPARAAILGAALASRPTAEGLDLRRLVARTAEFSGADLAHLVESAAGAALQRSVASGSMSPIAQRDLDVALGEITSSTRGWFATAHNYALYANDGGQYDDLLAHIRRHRLV